MPRFDFAPSGELRLHATEPAYSYTSTTWTDTKRQPLETQVSKILHRLLTIALDRQRHREEEPLRQIEERKQERLRELVRQRRTANQKLIQTLETQAGAWARAQFLRRYLRTARRTLGSRTLTADLQG
jgi:gamma-glutamyl:cysteine ligase YbdK (ATP-grasp superfamily)